ncbi:MAG TPA: energy transducer TonB [Candidatus Angelobacter sp.]|nr:energy transducer TonB [Candidatus Angelobacter sp.]
MVLRSPFTRGDQKFDSSGRSLTPPPSGPWLTYGGIYVKNLKLSSNVLRLEGKRVGFGTDKKREQTQIALRDSMEVEIHLDGPLKSVDEAQAVLGRVFLEGASVEQAKPEIRRADDSTASETIYEVKNGVLPPRATYTPAPEFSVAARKAKFQGTVIVQIVIDKRGDVTRIKLDRGAGYGLDENAMEAVKIWRFTPATKDGQPVAVRMKIEVSFNLY